MPPEDLCDLSELGWITSELDRNICNGIIIATCRYNNYAAKLYIVASYNRAAS